MLKQVKVLELEQALQQERLRLGTLRKKHYELAESKREEEETVEENPVSYNLQLVYASLVNVLIF